jgi:hypothetical protein
VFTAFVLAWPAAWLLGLLACRRLLLPLLLLLLVLLMQQRLRLPSLLVLLLQLLLLWRTLLLLLLLLLVLVLLLPRPAVYLMTSRLSCSSSSLVMCTALWLTAVPWTAPVHPTSTGMAAATPIVSCTLSTLITITAAAAAAGAAGAAAASCCAVACCCRALSDVVDAAAGGGQCLQQRLHGLEAAAARNEDIYGQ